MLWCFISIGGCHAGVSTVGCIIIICVFIITTIIVTIIVVGVVIVCGRASYICTYAFVCETEVWCARSCDLVYSVFALII